MNADQKTSGKLIAESVPEQAKGERPVNTLKRSGRRKAPKGALEIKSFGLKYGVNPIADLQIDLRNRIRNPQTHLPMGAVGTAPAVKKAVLGSDTNRKIFERYLVRVRRLLNKRKNLIISFGCTSGIHRSVVFAEELAARLRNDGYDVKLTHFHLRDQASKSKDE